VFRFLLILLLSTALVIIQWLIGGTRPAFAFPAYALLAAAAIVSMAGLRRPSLQPSAPALLSALAFGGYVLGRAWLSPMVYLAGRDLTLAAAALAVYLLVALHLGSIRERTWLVGALLLIALGEVVIGSLQAGQIELPWLVLSPDLFIVSTEHVRELQRATGTLVNPNHFAGFLEMTGALALGFACWSRWHFVARLAAWATAAACYYGVLLSSSRGGYFSAGASLLVFAGLGIWMFYVARRRYLITSLVVGTLIVATLGGLVFVLGSTQKRVQVRFAQDWKDDMRNVNWEAARRQAELEPWWGTGAGTHLVYGRLFRDPILTSDPIHAHNDYLETLAEYGRVGLGLALLFALIHLVNGVARAYAVADRHLYRRGVPASNTLALQLGALAALVAMLIHSVVDFNLHVPGNALTLAALLGVLAGSPRGRETVPGVFSPTFFSRLVLVGLGIGLAVLITPRWKGERLSEEARIALRAGEYKRASIVAMQASIAQPDNPYNWFYLGEAYRVMAEAMPVRHLKEKHFTDAVDAYAKAGTIFPEDENFWVRMAQALDGLGRFDEAARAYRKAIALDPHLVHLHFLYSKHLELKGLPKLALQVRQERAQVTKQDSPEILEWFDAIEKESRREAEPASQPTPPQ